MPEGVKQPETVFITGASAGVGRALARLFGEKGADVGLFARNIERLKKAQEEIEDRGGRAIILPGDVTDITHLEAAAEEVEEAFGPITIWINNATASMLSPLYRMTAHDFQRVTDVAYLGVVYGTMVALNHMLPRNNGTIVQVGSILAYRSIPLQSAHCGAKHGIRGFTNSVRTELMHEKRNIRLTIVQLPSLNTPFYEWVKSSLPRQPKPVAPIFQPEVAARAIYWAAHQHKREVYVSFFTTSIIWLNKLLPAVNDFFLAREGYSIQQSNEAIDAKRSDNLYQTMPNSLGARGRFNAEATGHSPQVWLMTHPWVRLLGGVGILIALILFFT